MHDFNATHEPKHVLVLNAIFNYDFSEQSSYPFGFNFCALLWVKLMIKAL